MDTSKKRKKRKKRKRYTNAAVYTVNGQSWTISEWAEILGVNKETLRWRLKQGIPPELVFRSVDYRALNRFGDRTEDRMGSYSKTQEEVMMNFMGHNVTGNELRQVLEDNIRFFYNSERMTEISDTERALFGARRESAESLYLWFFGGKEMLALHKRLEKEWERTNEA